MKRIAATALLSLFMIGCGERVQQPERVSLVTGVAKDEQLPNGEPSGCYAQQTVIELTYDPTWGTGSSYGPIAWRPGYTARRAGSEIEILDPDGNVEAITGKKYWVMGGNPNGWPDPQPEKPIQFWICAPVLPFLGPGTNPDTG